MDKSEKNQVDRRLFVRAGLTSAAVTVGCLRFGLREALAQARLDGKQLLTDLNLRKFFDEQERIKTLSAVVGELARDPLAFLEKHFTVTAEQRRQYESLSGEDKAKLKQAAAEVGRLGTAPDVHFVAPVSPEGQTSRVFVCMPHATTPKHTRTERHSVVRLAGMLPPEEEGGVTVYVHWGTPRVP